MNEVAKVAERSVAAKNKSGKHVSSQFIRDIAPFFQARSITYVDVGAYVGDVYEALAKSEIKLLDAYLIEPNPNSFRTLEATVAGVASMHKAACHNLAISSHAGKVVMQDSEDMTRVVSTEDNAEGDGGGRTFVVSTMTLDEFAQKQGIQRISLLKIDVEGHELDVIKGAGSLFASERVDVLYVEAGMNPESTQQTYFRLIEDALHEYGYRAFKIYEQTHEWAEDNPVLRRVNVAFMSSAFAAANPYKLSREIHQLRKENELLAESKTQLEQRKAALETDLRSQASRADEYKKQAAKLLESSENERKRFLEIADDLGQVKDKVSWVRKRVARIGETQTKDQEEIVAIKEGMGRVEETFARMQGEFVSVKSGVADVAGALREWIADAERSAIRRGEELRAGLARELEEQKLQSARERARKELARRDLDRVSSYAQQLEAGLRDVLDSRTWKVMEPYRFFVRMMKKAFTGRVELPIAPPARPIIETSPEGAIGANGKASQGAGFKTEGKYGRRQKPVAFPELGSAQLIQSAGGRTTADYAKALVASKTKKKPGSNRVPKECARIDAELKVSDYQQLFRLMRQYETELATESGYLLYSFLLVLMTSKISAYGVGVKALDTVFAMYAGKRDQLLAAYGSAAYERFVANAAIDLTRVGRYADARELLDAEIGHGITGLLPVRAEIAWIHDPELALRDLERYLRTGAKGASALLYKHLALNVLGTGASALSIANDGHRELILVDALRSKLDGDFAAFRDGFNRFFEAQGLSGPVPVSETEFAFGRLSAEGARVITDGPLVSVIMTTYNSSATLDYAVRSVLDQTYANIELLIVDDCSSDGTREMLQEIAERNPRVRVLLNETNLGTYGAKNRAMEVAKGEFMTCHDSDDWAHPQRIESHVREMQVASGLMATRSYWLRMDEVGEVQFRRWGKKFIHPNPASVFFRREVVERIGYFDSVRFGADSEYIARIKRVFGREAVRDMKQVLALGLHHDQSLTRAGAGAMGDEQYSPTRSAYHYSKIEWHSLTGDDDLYIEARPGRRRFWAPDGALDDNLPGNSGEVSLGQQYPGLVDNKDASLFVFGISLAGKQSDEGWARTQFILARTLRSLLNQSDPRFRVVICGHERPDLPALDDPRVIFMTADIPKPKGSSQYRDDKMWKRRLIGAALRNLGGGYFFPLDADDLVHRDLVHHVLADDNRRGYNIDRGYVEDFAGGRIAPVPGVWSVSFDRVCGSSAVIYFEPEDLPRNGKMEGALYFNHFQSHAYWPIVAEEWGRPLDSVPFPAAVYVVNHEQNLSFGLQRAGRRSENVVRAIERTALADRDAILSEQFSQS
ncbi:FkbM family methyltransferase [Luteimonas sp. BDR2-5]|uniref:FkbM family methyltransferase n=1 Tax=Proluteimonas luteida TaxID=2878685 RepID=UPI001E4E132C|nr:FkbM family methyltransferase [Luteimonas sp. BDR2-5]MCD9027308.1 FkbM family methyltransferase [Luteimonas sp. BDR2-5]